MMEKVMGLARKHADDRYRREMDKSGKRQTRWCSNGCGKSVIYLPVSQGWYCNRCGVMFEKLEEIDEAH